MGSRLLAYNGELYHLAGERTRLEREVTLRGTSDTEVLAHLLERERTGALPRLNGIFAFAWVDTAAPDVLLARDRLGVKPLYYVHDDRGLFWASEAKALVPVLRTRQVAPRSAASYLRYGWNHEPEALIRGVRRLEAGGYLEFRDGGFTTGTSWRAERQPRSRAALRDVLETAVHGQMVSDRRVGILLSGGLDSSAIAALIRREDRSRITAFTVDYATADRSHERPHEDPALARQLSRTLGFPLETVVASEDTLERLPELVYALDEPLADAAPLVLSDLCARAKELDIPVLLSGQGSDELFAGYRAQASLLWSMRIPAVLRAGAGIGMSLAGRAASMVPPHPTTVTLQAAGRNLTQIGGVLRMRDAAAGYDASRALLGPGTFELLAGPALRDLPWSQLAREMGSLFDLQRAEMASILRDLNLAYTDRIGMHHTVEIRVPFLDNTVVDFALGLDARDVARLGTTKRVLREAMRGVLPKSVIRRRKSGFAGPVRAWMRNASRRAAVVRAVAGGTAREAGLLNPAGVRSIAPNSVPNSEYVLWSLLVLEVWMRLFVTGSALPSSRLSEVLDGG